LKRSCGSTSRSLGLDSDEGDREPEGLAFLMSPTITAEQRDALYNQVFVPG